MYIDTLAERSLITTDSSQISRPKSYKYGYTFLENSGQPYPIVS
jgi:chromosome segregation and condensation protein ScpB